MSSESRPTAHRSVEVLASKLRRRSVEPCNYSFSICVPYTAWIDRQVVGSRAAALETLLVLRQVISKARFSNFDQLVAIIRDAGRRLVEAQPKGLFILCLDLEYPNINRFIKNIPSVTQCGEFFTIYERSSMQRRVEIRWSNLLPHSQYRSLCYKVNQENMWRSKSQKVKELLKRTIPTIRILLQKDWNPCLWRPFRTSWMNWRLSMTIFQKMRRTTYIPSKVPQISFFLSILIIYWLSI